MYSHIQVLLHKKKEKEKRDVKYKSYVRIAPLRSCLQPFSTAFWSRVRSIPIQNTQQPFGPDENVPTQLNIRAPNSS